MCLQGDHLPKICSNVDSEAAHKPEIIQTLQNVKFYTHSASHLIPCQMLWQHCVSPEFVVLHWAWIRLTLVHSHTSTWNTHHVHRRSFMCKQSILRIYCKSYVRHCLLWVAERRTVVRVSDVTSVLREWADQLCTGAERLEFHRVMVAGAERWTSSFVLLLKNHL